MIEQTMYNRERKLVIRLAEERAIASLKLASKSFPENTEYLDIYKSK